MLGKAPRFYDCFQCGRRTKPKDRFRISKDHKQVLSKLSGRTPSEHHFICNRCRHVCRSYIKQKNDRYRKTDNFETENRTASVPLSPPSVVLPFPCTSRGHSYCCICKKPGPKLIVVPTDVRHRIFITREVIIPAGSRCCPVHLQGTIDDLKPATEKTTLSRTTITQLIKFLRDEVIRQERTRLDFNSLSNAEHMDLLGISRESLVDMERYIEGRVRATPARSVRTSLAIFLMKMRGGESNKVLSTLFNVSKSSVRRCIRSVRSALMSGEFVRENLGFQHITREKVIRDHTREIAKTLFSEDPDRQVILVLDGTYIYINKSGNFKFQRQSFSLHKGRPLVKPMVIVSTTGYFISVMGPYLARNNDASILNHILETNVEDIRGWIQEDDVFIVDRGFRDSAAYLEKLGIKAEMPAFMTRGESQMSTDSANTSRLVTKIRWVVESANSRIKQWTYLSRILPSHQIPFIGDFVRIVCAISNRYLKPLSCAPSNEDQAIGCKMLHLSHQANRLKDYVEENHLDRRTACWRPIEDVEDFPRLDEEQLRSLTCGTYQLRLSPNYAQEHLEGDCAINIHKEEPRLLRVRLQSRHVSSRTYQLWIRYDEANVVAWYCKCRAGARVVGMCAHVAAIVWYIGFARHRHQDQSIGVRNWGEYVEDAANMPLPIDESDSDDSGEASDTEE
ncbi:hypothetical protein FSP39_009062 [Pinctada imbricata]|uniref:SWIM-type domain-containing protein n=1 Tax=Pinctada imbricata TaxID=66713 RepID=A0AA88YIK3_PINIB|nr:hypothetical protein FSP39_009062 [Pinctada imbricata]